MCDLVSHAPYSPDLAPSDFQIFLKVNTFGGKGFSKDTELQSCSYGFFLRILTDETFEGVRKEHRLWKNIGGTLTRMERHHHQQNQFVTCLKNKDL
jgi:hypothetical protein